MGHQRHISIGIAVILAAALLGGMATAQSSKCTTIFTRLPVCIGRRSVCCLQLILVVTQPDCLCEAVTISNTQTLLVRLTFSNCNTPLPSPSLCESETSETESENNSDNDNDYEAPALPQPPADSPDPN